MSDNGSGSSESAKFDLIATSAFGLEGVVARELGELGYEAKGSTTGRIHFVGDMRAIVRANLWLRAADRVLIRVGEFPVGGGDAGFDALFEGVKGLEWERWIGPRSAFPVSGRCVRSAITSEPAVQRATKKAIVERLKGVYGGDLPETGPRVAVEVSILKDVATLTIDTSGVGLHKRGYREGTPGEAAVRETLAAGMVLLSVWRPGRALIDPFCGSGTIAIEAAMVGRNIAPGLNRGFDAEMWEGAKGKIIEPVIWEEERAKARAAVLPELRPTIHASDIDEHALRLARENAKKAGVERDIHFVKRDFAELESKKEYGVVICNPPYGVRLGDERTIERLYRSMPGVFRRLPTWSFHILTGRLDMEEIFGQGATRRRKLYNARIECTYFSFLGPRPPGEEEASRRDAETQRESRAESTSLELVGSEEEDAEQQVNETKPDGSLCVSASLREASSAAPAFGGLRERDKKEAGELAACLANNLRHLRKYPARGITCYRVYERDVPDVPLIVDRYEDRYHASEYEREHSRNVAQQADWFDLMRETIAQTAGVPVEHVYMKEKHRQRGGGQHEKKGDEGAVFVVEEGPPDAPLKFEVNLSDYTDTGLFLDHRLTRQMVREQAGGKRFLNLFCYTGAFTVYAAAGGAASTTSVDLSNTYLEWS
ncbi:MAG TPA: class I SAM-dependent methyltransferase, partial [Bacteroidota bacterium]|nr:class I SAM-dependent methyltransferase [Bacteroidota bacterium]